MSTPIGEPIHRAIVVDDELLVRELTMRALKAEGFRCDAAADGGQALLLAGETNYDLVVTDLRMPNGHGHGLAVSLLESDDRPVIMILTGVMEPRIAKDLLSRGVDDIVFKPVDYELFALKASELVRRRQKIAADARSGPGPLALEPAGAEVVAPQTSRLGEQGGVMRNVPPADTTKRRAGHRTELDERFERNSPDRQTENDVAAIRCINTRAELLRRSGEAAMESLRQRILDLEQALATIRGNGVWKAL